MGCFDVRRLSPPLCGDKLMSPIANLSVLEIIGVVSFALLGAHTAVQRRMDLF